MTLRTLDLNGPDTTCWPTARPFCRLISYSAAGIIANGTLTAPRFPAGIPFAGEAAY